MQVHLSGHLNWYHPQKISRFEMPVLPQTRPADLLAQLGVPPAEVAVILVNGRLVEMNGDFLHNEDVVEIFPPVSGG